MMPIQLEIIRFVRVFIIRNPKSDSMHVDGRSIVGFCLVVEMHKYSSERARSTINNLQYVLHNWNLFKLKTKTRIIQFTS